MTDTHRLVIAGGGIAGLEALLTIHALAPDRVVVTLADPSSLFEIQARAVEPPFGLPGSRRYDLGAICDDLGVSYHRARLDVVRPYPGEADLSDSAILAYDSLVVAVGAERVAAFPEAITFRDARDVEHIHGIVREVESGYLRTLALVVPRGVTWPLPLYELALLIAARARRSRAARLAITLVTPEPRPLDVLGAAASDRVGQALQRNGVHVLPDTGVATVVGGTLFDDLAGELLQAQRVVAIPILAGRAPAGLPVDADGFVQSDAYARVDAMRGVYVVGDASAQPIKNGALAAQQAVAAATHVAMRAGEEIRPLQFKPALRAKLLAGDETIFLRHELGGDRDVVSAEALWWPPLKVVAPRLSDYLVSIDYGERGAVPATRRTS